MNGLALCFLQESFRDIGSRVHRKIFPKVPGTFSPGHFCGIFSGFIGGILQELRPRDYIQSFSWDFIGTVFRNSAQRSSRDFPRSSSSDCSQKFRGRAPSVFSSKIYRELLSGALPGNSTEVSPRKIRGRAATGMSLRVCPGMSNDFFQMIFQAIVFEISCSNPPEFSLGVLIFFF